MGSRGQKFDLVSKNSQETADQNNEERIYLPKWFRDRERIYEDYIEAVKIETEKAVLVTLHGWDSDRQREGYRDIWVPKSILKTQAELKADAESFRAKEKEREKRMADGLKRNQQLLEKARSLGVKGVRKGMKTSTLLKKIKDAGFSPD